MKRLFFAIAILPWVLFACNRASEHFALNERGPEATTQSADISIPVQDTTVIASENDKVPNLVMDLDKKIIKTAVVTLEVKNYEQYTQKLKSVIKKYGAYIAKEENQETDEKKDASVSVKVPVFYFEDLLNDLPGADAKQLERNIRSEEVNGAIVDTRARLLTKKQTRDKYLEFLKQGKNVEEVLKVQNEVNALQEEIESAESRLAWLSGQARYSTVELNYFEPKAGYASGNRRSLGGRMAAALKEGAEGLGSLLVGLLYLWPLWLTSLLLIWLVRKRNWLRLQKNR